MRRKTCGGWMVGGGAVAAAAALWLWAVGGNAYPPDCGPGTYLEIADGAVRCVESFADITVAECEAGCVELHDQERELRAGCLCPANRATKITLAEHYQRGGQPLSIAPGEGFLVGAALAADAPTPTASEEQDDEPDGSFSGPLEIAVDDPARCAAAKKTAPCLLRCGRIAWKAGRKQWVWRGCNGLARLFATPVPTATPLVTRTPKVTSTPRLTGTPKPQVTLPDIDPCPGGCVVWDAVLDMTRCERPCMNGKGLTR